MGISFGCPRRQVLEEPQEEPEPVPVSPSHSGSSAAVTATSELSSDSPAHSAAPGNQLAAPESPWFLIGNSIGRETSPIELELVNWEYTDIRVYTVWRIPQNYRPTDFSGIHWSNGLSAYSAFLRLNNGVFEGLVWQRSRSLADAIQLFEREAASHQVDDIPIRFFRCSLGWPKCLCEVDFDL